MEEEKELLKSFIYALTIEKDEETIHILVESLNDVVEKLREYNG